MYRIMLQPHSYLDKSTICVLDWALVDLADCSATQLDWVIASTAHELLE